MKAEGSRATTDEMPIDLFDTTHPYSIAIPPSFCLQPSLSKKVGYIDDEINIKKIY